MKLRLLAPTIAFTCLLPQLGHAALVRLDDISRVVATKVTGGVSDSDSASAPGAIQLQATSNGTDSSQARALQSVVVQGGDYLSLYSPTDMMASGQRGGGFAPVSLHSESLVSVTFTVSEEAGPSAFWLGGKYTILGDATAGNPTVEWSLAPESGVDLFRHSATSGSEVEFNETGTLNPGTYRLDLNAKVGNAFGPGSFLPSNAQGAAALQGLNMVVTPITPVPEPSTGLLILLGAAMTCLRRQRKA